MVPGAGRPLLSSGPSPVPHPHNEGQTEALLSVIFFFLFFSPHCASFTNLSGLVLEADDDFLFTQILEHFRDKNGN